MKKTTVDELERRCTLLRLLVFECCHGDVDLSLNIGGKTDALRERTRVMVGRW